MQAKGKMSTIHFRAPLFKIGSWTVLLLPKEASAKLPSRGLAFIKGTINGSPFQTALEPDGRGSHWLRLNKTMLKAAKADAGDTVTLIVEPAKVWPEPDVPSDLKKALADAPQAHKLWKEITPMARWDWIRWIGSTKNPETRRHRIEVTFSKFKDGKRRPCCFNRTICTIPNVSNNGKLLEPTQETA